MAINKFNNADHYIDLVQHLPPAPTIAIELLGLFDDPDRDIDRIVELIGLDPSLTLEVLKRCGKATAGAVCGDRGYGGTPTDVIELCLVYGGVMI